MTETLRSYKDLNLVPFDSVSFAIEDFSALRYIRDLLAKPGKTNLCEDIDLIADPDDPRDLFGMVSRNGSASIAA